MNLQRHLKQILRKVPAAILSAGGLAGLGVGGLMLILTAVLPVRFVGTAVLNIQFVSTNSVVLTAEQYATNDFGWAPWSTEKRVIRSERVLRKALALGDLTTTPALLAGHVETRAIREGIRLLVTDKDPERAASLAKLVAMAYSEERKEMAPAPPGCKGLSVMIQNDPKKPGVSVDWSVPGRFVLSAVSLGLATAMGVTAWQQKQRLGFVPRALFWLFLLLGWGIHLTPTLATALAGATCFSLLIAASRLCISIVRAQHPPLPRNYLRNIFAAGVVLVGVITWAQQALEADYPWTTSRVRVSAVRPCGQDELPLSYDPDFLAGQTELIQSDVIAGQARKPLQEPWDHFQYKVSATAIRGTSVIEIGCGHVLEEKSRAIAKKITEAYQDYSRQMTNAGLEVKISPLGSETRFQRSSRTYGQPWFYRLTELFLSMLFFVAGAVCLALLAKTPNRMAIVPAGVLVYFVALGLAWCVSIVLPASYTAVSMVRPASSLTTHKTQTEGALEQELHVACSEEVLARAAGQLKNSSQSLRLESRTWPATIPEQVLWLKQHVKVSHAGGKSLIRFSASAASQKAAALIANAVAESYCAMLETASGRREILTRATPPFYRDRSANIVAMSLHELLPHVLPFTLGAIVAYYGYLWRKCTNSRIIP